MKVLVIGASGGVGREVVTQALDAGHEVTALLRRPEGFDVKHERLRAVKGDVLDRASLDAVMPGHDVVLTPFGPRSASGPQTLYTAGGANIVAAMKAAGVKRIIAVTSGGVEDDPGPPLIYRWVIKPLFLQKGYDDHKRFEAMLKDSGLEWIVVRPYRLLDGPRTGRYRVSPRFLPAKPVGIHRADIADFMVKQLGSDEWLRQTPTLAV